MKHKADILILGGGVIGLCVAYFAQLEGREVTVIDQDDLGAGSSFGNAGLINVSHVSPLAHKGALPKEFRWLWDSKAPLYYPFQLEMSWFQWWWRFFRASKAIHVKASVSILSKLAESSLELYRHMNTIEGLDFEFKENGLLVLYQDVKKFDSAVAQFESKEEERSDPKILSGQEVRRQEPSARLGIVGGIHFKKDAQVDPASFIVSLGQLIEAKGASVVRRTEALDFEMVGKRIRSVRTTRGTYYANHVVLATGAWSKELASRVGFHMPLEPAKGYSATYERPELCPKQPLLLEEARVYLTPMDHLLRVAGTLEFKGLDRTLDSDRLSAMLSAANDYTLALEKAEPLEVWRGFRPCMPDGLPVIGPSPVAENLLIATGHGMRGMALGPITGKLIAALACKKKPEIDLSKLTPKRF